MTQGTDGKVWKHVTAVSAAMWEADMMERGSGNIDGGLSNLMSDQQRRSPIPPLLVVHQQHSLPDPDCIRPGRGEFVPTPPSDLERDRDYYKALHALDQTMIAVLVAERDYLCGLVDDLTLKSTPIAGPAPEAPKPPRNPFREHPDDRRRVGSLLGSIA